MGREEILGDAGRGLTMGAAVDGAGATRTVGASGGAAGAVRGCDGWTRDGAKAIAGGRANGERFTIGWEGAKRGCVGWRTGDHGRTDDSDGGSGARRGELALSFGDGGATRKSGDGGAGSLTENGGRNGCSGGLGEARTGASPRGRWNSAER